MRTLIVIALLAMILGGCEKTIKDVRSSDANERVALTK